MKDQLEALVLQMYRSNILYSEGVREFKKRFILTVLQENKGNQCRAARELGMHRNTLSRTITELKIDVRQLRDGVKRPPRSARPDERWKRRSSASSELTRPLYDRSRLYTYRLSAAARLTVLGNCVMDLYRVEAPKKRGSPRGLPLIRQTALLTALQASCEPERCRLLAAGAAALARSSCPFSITIMNGFGVYEAGSPWKSKLAPSFGTRRTGTLSSNFRVISAFLASMSSELPAIWNSVGVVLMTVPFICTALPLIAFHTVS